ncbi:BgTH12-02170 [Blumeria graminis f. sp. triticale]|uniref:BgtAc-31535 n=3 Tax=Blumeria graminis TaxID=34373 RepID=A0A9X9MG81_BLUGR|nr:hypothetical protein BGT96224_Ac31535 [Blumeria graminis f. sp. tritici 96224]CAD6501925.1 BgTH12-02170 [Blumeria graminis f. sp. triticale]VDB85878.1 BgtAc-31535 [Blumeria graminis f. sp. tritici]
MRRITCVLAFLVTIQDHSLFRNRMVLVGNEEVANYGIYKMFPTQRFPKPKSSNILMAQFRESQESTLITSYCSPFLDMNSIINDITSDLMKMIEPADLDFEGNNVVYNYCLYRIRNGYHLFSKVPALSMAQFMARNKCPTSIIARLALENYLRVTGKYKCFAPYENNAETIMIADSPVDLSVEIWKSEMFIGESKGGRLLALAWYQGHLHIFGKKKYKHDHWYLVTKVGNEINNGKLIYDFIFQEVQSVRNMKSLLETENPNFYGAIQRFIFNNLTGLYLHFLNTSISQNVLDGLQMVVTQGSLVCSDDS